MFGFDLGKCMLAAAFSIVAAFFLTAAAVFLCFAAYLWFETILIPPWAALATAGSGLVFACFWLLVAWLLVRRPRPPKLSLNDVEELAARLGGVGGAVLKDYAKEQPYTALLISLAAGIVVGLNPGLVRDIERLLRRK